MIRIHSVLTSNVEKKDQSLSVALVNNWIGNLRAIPYGFSTDWKTPEEVQHGAYADCKGKAVALYNTMHAQGADNLRLVIGKRLASSRKTHAWLEWTTSNGTYILDPTILWSACRAEHTGRSSYIPLYAYDGGKKYRAGAGTSLFANNRLLGGQRVASRL
jgi:predicted transglutaminase-like cysteine proteinase